MHSCGKWEVGLLPCHLSQMGSWASSVSPAPSFHKVSCSTRPNWVLRRCVYAQQAAEHRRTPMLRHQVSSIDLASGHLDPELCVCVSHGSCSPSQWIRLPSKSRCSILMRRCSAPPPFVSTTTSTTYVVRCARELPHGTWRVEPVSSDSLQACECCGTLRQLLCRSRRLHLCARGIRTSSRPTTSQRGSAVVPKSCVV